MAFASGNTLDQFTTFWESTGPRYLKGLKDLINEEQKHTYTMPRLMKGHSMEEMIQAGSHIKDRIFFDVESTFQRINPNHTFNYSNKQTGTDWAGFWSIAAGYVVWNKWEKSLNVRGGDLTDAALTHIFKDLMRQKFQNMYTDYCNSREAELWAQPDESKMEGSTTAGGGGGNTEAPMSIPVFLNEYWDANPPSDPSASGSATVTDADTGTWSTIQGIDPAGQTKWRCAQAPYDFEASAAGGAAKSGPLLFSALMGLWHNLRWDRLPKNPEYGEKTTSPHFIGTQLAGVLNFEHALRINQDIFRGMGKSSGQDPAYPGPTFMGIPVERIAELETASIYPTGLVDVYGTYDSTANVTHGMTANDGATVIGYGGPRYYMINGEYLRPTYHSDDYFTFTEVLTPPDRPFDRIQVYSTTNQLVCRSRMRAGGIAFPGTKGGAGDDIESVSTPLIGV